MTISTRVPTLTIIIMTDCSQSASVFPRRIRLTFFFAKSCNALDTVHHRLIPHRTHVPHYHNVVLFGSYLPLLGVHGCVLFAVNVPVYLSICFMK